MAKWPLVGNRDANEVANGAQTFSSFGGGGASSTEAQAQQQVRDTYTASNLRAYIIAQSGDDSAITMRTNAADDTMTLSITGTGEFEDAINTDDLVSDDEICLDLDALGGMHGDSFTPTTFQITLDAASNVPFLASSTNLGLGSSQYLSVVGPGISATETDVEYTTRTARTLRDLRVYVTTITPTDTFVVRKNQADGNGSLSLTGTGEFIDTSNTDSFAAGDEVNFLRDTGAGGLLVIRVVSTEGDTSSCPLLFGGVDVGAATSFLGPSGLVETTTEAEAQVEAEDVATIQNLFVNCFSHAETRTIRTRKNAGNGNASVSVTGTGLFEDLVNTDALVAEDDLSIQQDAGSAGTNSYFAVVEWETAAAIDPDEIMAALRTQGEQEPIRVPAEVVSYG